MNARNTTLVAHIDMAGGGQVWVDGSTLYVGHMSAPHGTTIVDVADPRKPRVLASLEVPAGYHSHKVRVANNTMVVNHEMVGRDDGANFGGGGLGIYDISNPAQPVLRTKWKTGGKGVHRFSFDGRYAYISPTVDGYAGNIAMILDLADPAHPQEVGRWWMPGQWTAGGEEPGAGPGIERCHHPLRLGDRLYVSYWHGGGMILDISDMTQPRPIARIGTNATFPHPTHTLLTIPEPLKGRRVMLVADEDVDPRFPTPPAFLWIYDVTNEATPVPIGTFQVAGIDPDGAAQPPMTGCHQPSERFSGTIIPCAWFAQGLRLLDISDPFAPKEVGSYQPDPAPGAKRASSNDVTLDDRGLIYLVDRQGGIDILETSVW